MIGKLLKHDFISSGRIMGVVYIIVAALAGFTLISHYSKKTAEPTIAESLGVAVLVLVAALMFFLTTVIVLVDFHKTMYSEQGYLTFTLPVRGWQLLLSKLIVSTVWFVIALAAFFASCWLVIIVFRDEIMNEDLEQILSLLNEFVDFNPKMIIIRAAINVIRYFIMFAFFIMTVYFTSTLAHTRLFQKRSILWTIVLFVPIAVPVVKLADFIDSKIVFALYYSESGLKLITDSNEFSQVFSSGGKPIDMASIFVYFILAAAIFYVTHYIMSKKINI